ncbi:MAG: DNA polymerase III subunit alpha [Pseudomonadota bacterium]
MTPRFLHLRVHSAYSLLAGAIHLKAPKGSGQLGLVDLVTKAGFPAVAVTDTNNLYGALEFAEGAAKAGLQPIIGCELHVAYLAAPPGAKPPAPAPLVLLAQDRQGYENLMWLTSRAYLHADPSLPVQVRLADLHRRSAGLICLTGGADGPLGREIAMGRDGRALAERLAALFPGRLYVEIQRHGTGDTRRTPAEEATEPGLVTLAYDLDLPLVATNSVYYATPGMAEAHDAFLCIGQGTYVNDAKRDRLTPEHYLKSEADMLARFQDLPEATENTVEIARRCAYRPRTHPPILPNFVDAPADVLTAKGIEIATERAEAGEDPLPKEELAAKAKVRIEATELARQARDGLAARLAVIPHAAPVQEYEDRLEFELKIIEGMGFPGYFLIVADFIKWAKQRRIPVGPGRGSGAGSLVAYALTITDLDPLRYGLLFERFLNPDRVSMPDFDIDFCQDRREEVIAYVQEKYGQDRVAQIITFGALLSKMAVRDVGRVLQMSYSHCDRLSKLIPIEGVKPVSIAKARVEEPKLNEEARREEVVETLLDYAQKLEGLFRNASTHAAGVVIGDRPLVELVPLYQDPRSDMPATQFNMKWVEPAGLVKFDFLGLKTLTVVQNCLDLLRLRNIEIDIGAIPLDDAPSYDLYSAADTVGVFQVESAGMRDALRQMRPTCIEDIVALVALYRPGPMENIPKYCNVKNGREERDYLHPTIDAILDETQGIIVYQEQVMEIARKMAGYSLGGADLLRRAMGKKIQEAMDAERPKFLAGAAENGVDEAKALEVWNLLDKFANYGFNKSHAAAYAVVSYQTAYLKANYPVEFMAAVMNLDLHLTDKLNVYVQECRRMGVDVVAPCVQQSEATFTVRDGKVLYALGALKNVGVEAMKPIVEARIAGPFHDLFDLARRVDLKMVGKRPLENLARAGAFDALDPNRRRVHDSLDKLVDYSATCHAEQNSNQGGLFGAADALPPPRLSAPEDWLPSARLGEEHGAVGFYLSGHPLDDYMGALGRKGVKRALDVMNSGGAARVAGTLTSRRERKSARGTRFAFIEFSDPQGIWEVMAFSDVLTEADDLLQAGANLVCHVEMDTGGDNARLMLRAVQRVEQVAEGAAQVGLEVHVEHADAFDSIRNRLELVSTEARRRRGEGPVRLVLPVPDQDQLIEINLPGQYAISTEIRGAIKAVPGVQMVAEF